MALTLECPWRTPERILTFGAQGTGKSRAILEVARKCPDATFHVVDGDVSESYNRALDVSFTDLQNVNVHRVDPDDFMDMFDTVKDLAGEVKQGDWLVVDSMTSPWSSVQSWFIESIHGVETDEYFMEIREQKKAAKKGQPLAPFEGYMDWPVINKKYAKLTSMIFKTRGHLYLTAESARIGDQDDSHVKGLYGPYGVKPAGQKRLGHMPSTVLLLGKSRAGEYSLTTVKDRDRQEVEGMAIENFASDYLVKIAGWKRKVMK